MTFHVALSFVFTVRPAMFCPEYLYLLVWYTHLYLCLPVFPLIFYGQHGFQYYNVAVDMTELF